MSFEEVYFGATKGHEGGYVDDPDDSGGETFRGVSRRSHPAWVGWGLIEVAKRKVGSRAGAINSYFKNDTEMDKLVAQVYFNKYWKPLAGDPELPERLKMKLFDTSVNTGLKPAVRIMQQALNDVGGKLSEDGKMGPLTRKAAIVADEQKALLAYSKYQKAHYEELIKKNPKYIKYREGWLKRAAWLPK